MKQPQGRLFMYDGLKSMPVDDDPAWAWTTNSVKAGTSAGASTAFGAYDAVPHVYRGVNLRANALARMPRYIYRDDEPVDEAELDFVGDLTDTLWRVSASLALSGAAYLWKGRNAVRLVKLRWFATSTITPITDVWGGLVKFQRSIGQQRDYAVDDIAYLWLPSASVEVGPGTAPAMAALTAAGLSYNMGAFASKFFERGAVKPVLLYSDAIVSDSQKNEFESWAERMVTGIRNAFRLRVMRFKVEKLDIADKLTDTIPQELPRQAKEDIATALGVPYSLLFSDAANYATAGQDWRNFYDQTAIPEAELVQAALNRQVFAPLGLELYFAPEELPAMQTDETARAGSLNTLVGAGMPTDMAMVQLGYDLAAGDRARIRLRALMAEGASYEAASAHVLATTPDEEREQAAEVLALFVPVPAPAPAAPPIVVENWPTQAPQDDAPQEAEADDEEPTLAALRKWQRKATKRVRAGKPATCDFEDAALPEATKAAISGALSEATTADDVRRAFAPALRWGVYP